MRVGELSGIAERTADHSVIDRLLRHPSGRVQLGLIRNPDPAMQEYILRRIRPHGGDHRIVDAWKKALLTITSPALLAELAATFASDYGVSDRLLRSCYQRSRDLGPEAEQMVVHAVPKQIRSQAARVACADMTQHGIAPLPLYVEVGFSDLTPELWPSASEIARRYPDTLPSALRDQLRYLHQPLRITFNRDLVQEYCSDQSQSQIVSALIMAQLEGPGPKVEVELSIAALYAASESYYFHRTRRVACDEMSRIALQLADAYQPESAAKQGPDVQALSELLR